jgi:serine/threonine protein kinase
MLLLNRYEYNPQTDTAGRGEFSRVYKALDTASGETVAIKIYKINELSDHYRPIRHTETMRTLMHPGLCKYFDIEEIEKEDSFGEKEKLQVCVTSFINDGNIVNYYKNNSNPAVLIKLLQEILNGLSYLHKKEITHGYIKPSNILITETNEDPSAKITDYAMGIFTAGIAASNSSHPLLSAVSYLSPEQLNPNKYGINGKVSSNTDLWSLALVIYETLTGEPLFKVAGTDFAETLIPKITGFELPEKINTLPQPFAAFLKACLVKDAGQRVQTVEELLTILFDNNNPETGIFHLEEKPGVPLPAETLTTLASAAEKENPDDTRIIALPKKNNADDDTQIIARPVNLQAADKTLLKEDTDAEDDTRIISRSINTAPPADEPVAPGYDNDDTQIITRPVDLKLSGTAATEEDSVTNDDTRIIFRPVNDPPPVTKDHDEDATQIITRPGNFQKTDSTKLKEDAAPDDHTKIISQPVNDPPPVTNDHDEDATQIIARPGNFQQTDSTKLKADAAPDDDTRIISDPSGNKVPVEGDVVKESDEAAIKDVPAIDETIIIAKLNKENKTAGNPASTTNSNDANSPADEEKRPAIIVRRREKPVVLFNRYEYLPATDLIGKGGFSRVYKAFDKKLSRWIALKIYKTGEFSDRYSPIAEIKRVVNLDHPNICRYLDIEEIENENPFGENEKIQVCVMELLDSGNFADYYRANKNPETLKKLIQDILNGLSYLHKNGIIHRDIKPGNILIKQTIEGPVAKITDFGISKNSDTENNSSSALIVSIPYMAPEQLNAKKYGINENIHFNLDLWSLGVTIYEVVTGKALFKNSDQDNSEQIMANIMAPELPEKLSDLPEPFKTIVSHCVIKNARERASRAEELMVLLHTAAKSADTSAVLALQAANPVYDFKKDAPIAEHTETESIKTAPADLFVVHVEDKIVKSRFSITDEEEIPLKLKETKKINPLAIFIGVAVLLFILFVIYIKTGNQPAVATSNDGPQKKDTVRNTALPVAAHNTANKDTGNTETRTDTTAKQVEEANKPVHVNEKKKEKPAEHAHKKESTQTGKANTAAKYVLILYTEQTCTLKINSIDYGELQNGNPLKIYLIPGNYILQFTSSSNSALTSTAKIEVKPENLGHADKFKISLK